MASRNEDLAAFLRSRRTRLTPAEAGIDPFPGPRRVPGLRREELAVAAGVSADYYRRVEQGRQAHVSEQVLDALARALHLDPVETAHLHDLARPAPPGGGSRPEDRQQPDPGLLRIMGALDPTPTLLLGRRSEILARSSTLVMLLGAGLAPGGSFVDYLLLDPEARARIVDWSDFAAAAVGGLRREQARRPGDALLAAQVDRLRAADPDVARWWDDLAVAEYTPSTKVLDHPEAGRLSFAIDLVTSPAAPDQHLVVYSAPPGSRTAELVAIMASWDATVPGEATGPRRPV